MTTQRKEPFGRPSIYTPELVAKICRLIATSTVGTNKLCKMHDDLPEESTIYQWRYDHPDFSLKYADAKMKQAELMAEKIRELYEVPTFEDKEGIERVDPGRVALQRLKVDTEKWYASKLAPKVYGDKSQPETSSTDNLKDVSDKLDKLMAAKQKEY